MLNGHTDIVLSVTFSSDDTCIVSGSCDKSVRIWDASMGALLTTLNGHTDAVNSVTFSSDGTRIVSGSWDNSVRVWDASMGALLHVIQEQTQAFINSVASSSDGTRVVSCPEDESALVSDLSMGCPPVWDYTIHGQHWISSPEYWIIWLPYHKRLAQWVPPCPSDAIYPHTCLVISRESSATIDFTNSKMGPNWATCYSPPS